MKVVKFIHLPANTNRSLTLLYILMLMACWYRHKGTCAQNCMILRMYWLSDPRLASLQGSPWGPEWPSLYQNFLYSVTWKEWRRSFEYTPLALLLFGKQYVVAFLYALFRLKSVFLYVEKKKNIRVLGFIAQSTQNRCEENGRRVGAAVGWWRCLLEK